MALEVTERAAQEIKAVLQQQNLSPENTYLRLGAKGGGCSGFTYALDIVDTKGDHDQEYSSQGIRIICDPKSLLYLDGTTLDFKDELMGRGFVFNNPNASSTCGCGNSFGT
jgi:iron-sulfur cluster assembly protein